MSSSSENNQNKSISGKNAGNGAEKSKEKNFANVQVAVATHKDLLAAYNDYLSPQWDDSETWRESSGDINQSLFVKVGGSQFQYSPSALAAAVGEEAGDAAVASAASTDKPRDALAPTPGNGIVLADPDNSELKSYVQSHVHAYFEGYRKAFKANSEELLGQLGESLGDAMGEHAALNAAFCRKLILWCERKECEWLEGALSTESRNKATSSAAPGAGATSTAGAGSSAEAPNSTSVAAEGGEDVNASLFPLLEETTLGASSAVTAAADIAERASVGSPASFDATHSSFPLVMAHLSRSLSAVIAEYLKYAPGPWKDVYVTEWVMHVVLPGIEALAKRAEVAAEVRENDGSNKLESAARAGSSQDNPSTGAKTPTVKKKKKKPRVVPAAEDYSDAEDENDPESSARKARVRSMEYSDEDNDNEEDGEDDLDDTLSTSTSSSRIGSALWMQKANASASATAAASSSARGNESNSTADTVKKRRGGGAASGAPPQNKVFYMSEINRLNSEIYRLQSLLDDTNSSDLVAMEEKLRITTTQMHRIQHRNYEMKSRLQEMEEALFKYKVMVQELTSEVEAARSADTTGAKRDAERVQNAVEEGGTGTTVGKYGGADVASASSVSSARGIMKHAVGTGSAPAKPDAAADAAVNGSKKRVSIVESRNTVSDNGNGNAAAAGGSGVTINLGGSNGVRNIDLPKNVIDLVTQLQKLYADSSSVASIAASIENKSFSKGSDGADSAAPLTGKPTYSMIKTALLAAIRDTVATAVGHDRKVIKELTEEINALNAKLPEHLRERPTAVLDQDINTVLGVGDATSSASLSSATSVAAVSHSSSEGTSTGDEASTRSSTANDNSKPEEASISETPDVKVESSTYWLTSLFYSTEATDPELMQEMQDTDQNEQFRGSSSPRKHPKKASARKKKQNAVVYYYSYTSLMCSFFFGLAVMLMTVSFVLFRSPAFHQSVLSEGGQLGGLFATPPKAGIPGEARPMLGVSSDEKAKKEFGSSLGNSHAARKSQQTRHAPSEREKEALRLKNLAFREQTLAAQAELEKNKGEAK